MASKEQDLGFRFSGEAERERKKTRGRKKERDRERTKTKGREKRTNRITDRGLRDVRRFSFKITAQTFDMVLGIYGCGRVVAWFTSTVGGFPV